MRKSPYVNLFSLGEVIVFILSTGACFWVMAIPFAFMTMLGSRAYNSTEDDDDRKLIVDKASSNFGCAIALFVIGGMPIGFACVYAFLNKIV